MTATKNDVIIRVDTDSSESDDIVMPIISLLPQTNEIKDTERSGEEMSRKSMSISISISDVAAKEKRQIDDMDFYILWLDLRSLPSYAQFLVCCGGVFFFYLLYGYFQVICGLFITP